MLTPHEKFSLEFARLYRRKNYNPLPSCMDEKRPMFKYAHLWDTLAPEEWFTPEGWPSTRNIQVMCGTRWKLLVVDLDGPGATRAWREMQARHSRCPKTWVVHREGGDSYHVWLRTPPGHTDPIKKRFAWKGDGQHEAIEILGDRSLVIAPPSVHVKTGAQYNFVNRECSPMGMGLPAIAPAWVLDLPSVVPDRPAAPPAPHCKPALDAPRNGTAIDRNELLARLGDKSEIAREWGLRLAGPARESGWRPCYAIGRQDAKPSAAIHVESGVYVDRGTGVVLAFPDVMRALGYAYDFADAMARLAERVK